VSLQPVVPTITVPLFPGLSRALLTLLRQLPERDWAQPTVCKGWSVKDVVAHLLGGNLGRLSFQRDRLQRNSPERMMTTNAALITWINAQNEAWVHAARRMSPPILIDFLELTDAQLHAFFQLLPPEAQTGMGVAWAGEETSANWLDIGREYTEQWFHQQQIREAVKVPGLVERQCLYPVMEICLRALPYTYRNVNAAEETAITVLIRGAAGGTWSLLRQHRHWHLYTGTRDDAITQITLSDDTAWRLFSKGLSLPEVQRAVTITGDTALGTPIWELVAIMA
jgi:uncharacterized protein (TIGR03083 family)